MPAHPARGTPAFETVKKSIAQQLGCIYLGPASIKTAGHHVIEYDEEGNKIFDGTKQEEVVEGVEAMAGGSMTMTEEAIKKMAFMVSPPGSLTSPTGPVAGSMPPGSGWVKAQLK